MHRSLIALTVSAAAMMYAAGSSAQERGPDDGGPKSEMQRGGERHDAKPAGERMEKPRAESREKARAPDEKARGAEAPREGMKPERRDAAEGGEHRKDVERKDMDRQNMNRQNTEGQNMERKDMQRGENREDMQRANEQKERNEERANDRKEQNEERAGEQHREMENANQRKDERAEDRYTRRTRLDEQQRTTVRRTISETIRTEHIERITNVDFNVRIGRFVPGRYRFYPLPPTIIEILPQYRGYDFVVADGDIVVVEPGTHRIVYTLPEAGGGGGGAVDESGCN